MIVYKAVNKVNGKVYVGQTVIPLERRIASHLVAKTGIFPHALRKYGLENFEIEPVAWCDTKEHSNFLEKFYIDYFKSKVPNGYNITDGGNGGMLGYRASEETRRKQSESSKGKNKGEKNGMFGKPSTMKGKRHREESKEKDSQSKKENWKDPDYRRKIIKARKSERYSKSMSDARHRLWQDPEYRTRQSKAHKKPRDYPESYKKMAEKNKAHWQDPEWKKARLEAMEKMRNSPEYKERLRIGFDKLKNNFYENPENHLKRSEIVKKSWIKRKEAMQHSQLFR